MTATESLRERAARGVIVNTAFDVTLQALNLLKGFVVAIFLTRADYGVWGILVVTLGTLTWLKQVGISEKFVQDQSADERLAFQRAFTLDLAANGIMLAILVAALPVFAIVYGQPKLILPGLVCCLVLPISSLRAPTWIFYRRMDFARQRLLDAADPVMSFVITIALAAAGAGYWSLVIGLVAGGAAAGAVAIAFSPHPLALRFDRSVMREYFAFSWPLFVANASALVIPQASMLVGEAETGLAGAGAIALASTVSSYSDRVDQIISATLYPVICRVQDQTTLLYEAFVKSNRLSLMWGIPFGAGVAVFADDLVHFVLGDKWRPAIGLIRWFGVGVLINHIAFNWSAFFRARGDTRPLAITAPLTLVAFLVFALPGLILFGLDGFGAGISAMALVSLVVRSFFLRRLFAGFDVVRYAIRSLAPTVPAVGAALAFKQAAGNSAAAFLAALALYLAVTGAATWLLERPLLREALGYLRAARA